jgi:hypothetical protein
VTTKPLTFATYRADAIEREAESLEESGLDSGACIWMANHPDLCEFLTALALDLAHRSLVGRKEDSQHNAIRTFKEGMARWIEKYVDSWSDAKQCEFIAEIEAERDEAVRLDRREGNLA